jgi:copper oxidase (laccase) domain-containing protein
MALDMKQLGEEILASHDARKKEVAEMIAGFQAEDKNRKKEVRDLLEGFKTEKEAMVADWQAFLAKRAKKRGIKPEVAAEAEVKTVKEEEEVKKARKKGKERGRKKSKKR